MKTWLLIFPILVIFPVCLYAEKGESKDFGNGSEGTRAYTGQDLKTIAFPIGGLAAGNITLGGRGNIKELEIFNRPSKGKMPELTFFSLWAHLEGSGPQAKILERQFLPPYEGWMGLPREQLAGVSRFEEAIFRGEYPFATLQLKDRIFPLKIELEAFNPFVPLSPDKSGIPGAVFNWKICNPTDKSVKVSIALSVQNPIKTKNKDGDLGFGQNVNRFFDEGAFQGIRMSSDRALEDSLEFGSIAFATTEKNVDVQTRWYRGKWWDNAHVFWDDFFHDGRLESKLDTKQSPDRKTDAASLLVHFELAPGETRIIPFFFSWYFPIRENYWNREKEVKGRRFKNYYANFFDDAQDVVRHLIHNIDDLTHHTRRFHHALFNSAYPSYVLDAVSANMSSLKTNVVIRNREGQFYGWEGLTDDAGCCMGTCTHVWNYEQTLAFLFPSLERSMREIAFLNDTFENGYQTFRTLFPPGNYWWESHPAADGQMGNIMNAYRDWKLSGNTVWLKRLWPKVKAALEFAWRGVGDGDEVPEWQKKGAPKPWDPNKDGVMEGRQHNTYDIDFYGPNTMVGSLYLGALRAASEMAKAVGDDKKSEEYSMLAQKGAELYDRSLWNGEYYVQKVHVMEGLKIPKELRSPGRACSDPGCNCKKPAESKREAPEEGDGLPKYQYGEGCLSDQLLGQYLAHVAGLGYVLPERHVEQALLSVYRYNFRKGLSAFSNVQRIYALNNEDGLLLCSWPKGNRPLIPFVYSDEVWSGIEYQVAASLIYSGYVEEGMAIIKAVRSRHRGFNRNPWNESECGHHYVRAMASWSVLLALSGYRYDGITNFIGFDPKIHQSNFSTFWSTGKGWGRFSVNGAEVTLEVNYGELDLQSFGISRKYEFKTIEDIRLNQNKIQGEGHKEETFFVIRFNERQTIHQDDKLVIIFR